MSIKIVQLGSYTTPEIIEVKNRDWVAYGEDNDYFQYLIDRHNGSPTNNAAINGISQLIFGQGLDATDSNKKPDEYARMKSLFNNDCVRKLAHDLKLLGQCSMQIIYSKDRSQIVQVEHFPVETLRAEKNNGDGEVEAYYYCPDWKKAKPNEEHKRIPAFGMSQEGLEILYVKPYRTGFYYYSPVDYQGGLQYSELEEEVANYHLNNIMNGLAPSMLINFNNGIPTEEERQMIEHRIQEKFSGTSNAGKFILAFNDNESQAASLEPVQLSDAHNQYQFLSDESMRKIMVSHRIVSPMLLGIKDSTGLGNNADELKTASNLMDNTVIRPFQDLLVDAFNEILAFNDISLDLYFKTLQPLEFADLENAMTKEQVEEETGQKLSLASKVIDGRMAYDTPEEAEAVAKQMGCKGYHTHTLDDQSWYMPCETHELKDADDPCYDGYEQYGMKRKNGRLVPNCIPIKNSEEELKEPCWDGYEMIGFKTKNGKKVPNCVPIDASEEEKLKEPCWDGYEMIGFKMKNGKKVPNCVPIEASKEIEQAILSHLEALQEDSMEDYELVDARPSNLEQDAAMSKVLKFANVIKGSPTKRSKQDTSLFKIRYQYAPLTVSDNSREFCRKMVSAKKLYRIEDLNKDMVTTPGMGPYGTNTYNPFLYKGGVNCKHFWMRKIYIRKNNQKISVNRAKQMINDLEPSDRKDARLPVNPKEVAQIAGPNNNNWRIS